MSKTITRRVRVNRRITSEAALAATGRVQYTDAAVVAGMPREGAAEVEVVFFNLGHDATDQQVADEYERQGLTPDPLALAAMNAADTAFADQYPNACHWKVGNQWHYLAFDRWYDGRSVRCGRRYVGWSGDWWFGGVRK